MRTDFDSFEGLMYRADTNDRTWTIAINTKVAYAPRRHFTLAHEMGHFIGHRELRKRFECTFESINDFEKEPLEIEANEFAAQFLMPPDVVRNADRNEFSFETVSDLAGALGVSRLAAAFRWANLSSRRIGFCQSRDGFVISGRASPAAFRAGLFFKGGSELPTRSLTAQLSSEVDFLEDEFDAGVWGAPVAGRESVFRTSRGDYLYTFIDLG